MCGNYKPQDFKRKSNLLRQTWQSWLYIHRIHRWKCAFYAVKVSPHYSHTTSSYIYNTHLSSEKPKNSSVKSSWHFHKMLHFQWSFQYITASWSSPQRNLQYVCSSSSHRAGTNKIPRREQINAADKAEAYLFLLFPRFYCPFHRFLPAPKPHLNLALTPICGTWLEFVKSIVLVLLCLIYQGSK